MGDKAFILAGIIVGFIFGLMKGVEGPKKLAFCALWGAIIGTGILLLVNLYSYAFTPIHVK